jgi:hypothetical protein
MIKQGIARQTPRRNDLIAPILIVKLRDTPSFNAMETKSLKQKHHESAK